MATLSLLTLLIGLFYFIALLYMSRVTKDYHSAMQLSAQMTREFMIAALLITSIENGLTENIKSTIDYIRSWNNCTQYQRPSVTMKLPSRSSKVNGL